MIFFITSCLCNRWARYTAPIRRYPIKKKGFVPSLVKICPLALEVQAYNPAVALYIFLVNFTSNIFNYIPNLFLKLVCRKCHKSLYKGLHFFLRRKKKQFQYITKQPFNLKQQC